MAGAIDVTIPNVAEGAPVDRRTITEKAIDKLIEMNAAEKLQAEEKLQAAQAALLADDRYFNLMNPAEKLKAANKAIADQAASALQAQKVSGLNAPPPLLVDKAAFAKRFKKKSGDKK